LLSRQENRQQQRKRKELEIGRTDGQAGVPNLSGTIQ